MVEHQESLTLHPSAETSLDRLALDALNAVESVKLVNKNDDRGAWWAEDAVAITDKDIVEEPEAWLPQTSGEMAFVFTWINDAPHGLTSSSYEKLAKLTEVALKVKWARRAVSEKYVEKCFVKWARLRLRDGAEGSFSSHFLASASRDIVDHIVIVPIQYLSVEESFSFGSVKFIPLGKNYFNLLQDKLVSMSPSQAEDTAALVGKMRADMGRCAGIELRVLAESSYTKEAALTLANDAVGLLRFFSQATVRSLVMSPLSTLGSLVVPTYHVIMNTTKGAFTYSNGISVKGADHWRISKAFAGHLKQEHLLDEVAKLLDIDELTEFQKAIRSAILAFSRATTFPELADRLVFAFSAIEGLMLKNQSEAIQQNVGERVAFLISNDPAERQEIVETFKEAYRMRSQYIHHRLTVLDVSSLDKAFESITAALGTAAANMQHFRTREDFIAAIERRKYGA